MNNNENRLISKCNQTEVEKLNFNTRSTIRIVTDRETVVLFYAKRIATGVRYHRAIYFIRLFRL